MGIEYPAAGKACYGSVSQAKYDALIARLKSDQDASNIATGTPQEGIENGSVTYQKIDFTWVYDPTNAELTVAITADHNWKAKIAGNQAIFGMLFDELISKA